MRHAEPFSGFGVERDSLTVELPDRGAYRSLTLSVENCGPLAILERALTIIGKVETLVSSWRNN